MGDLARNRKCTKMLTDRRTARRTDRPGSNSPPRPRYAAGGGLITYTYTVLNKSFATLHICLIFGSLSYANNFKVNIGKNTNHLHKQSNIFGKIMLIRYCFIAKTIHPGCITKKCPKPAYTQVRIE